MCYALHCPTPGLLTPKCETAELPNVLPPIHESCRYWLAVVDAVASAKAEAEAALAPERSASSEDALAAALSTLTLQQLIVGMEEPDLLPAALADAILHPVDLAFLKVLQELMAGSVTQQTHEMLCWCSEFSGDCAFVLSSLLTVGDATMGIERDVIRASTLLQQCSSKSEHSLCRLAWSNRLQVSRDSDERSASEKYMDDLDALQQVRAGRTRQLLCSFISFFCSCGMALSTTCPKCRVRTFASIVSEFFALWFSRWPTGATTLGVHLDPYTGFELAMPPLKLLQLLKRRLWTPPLFVRSRATPLQLEVSVCG